MYYTRSLPRRCATGLFWRLIILILGYILVVVSIDVSGDVEGKGLDYFKSYEECMLEGLNRKAVSPPGVSYACVEDYLR